jgi:hypothetical protein
MVAALKALAAIGALYVVAAGVLVGWNRLTDAGMGVDIDQWRKTNREVASAPLAAPMAGRVPVDADDPVEVARQKAAAQQMKADALAGLALACSRLPPAERGDLCAVGR